MIISRGLHRLTCATLAYLVAIAQLSFTQLSFALPPTSPHNSRSHPYHRTSTLFSLRWHSVSSGTLSIVPSRPRGQKRPFVFDPITTGRSWRKEGSKSRTSGTSLFVNASSLLMTGSSTGWHGESGAAKHGGHITVCFLKANGHIVRASRRFELHHVYPTDEAYKRR